MLTVPGIAFIANSYAKKSWLHISAAVSLIALSIFCIATLSFKDPEAYLEIVDLNQAVEVCKDFIQK